MPQSSPFLPHPVCSIEDGPRPSVPRVFISPQRYIQGAGALDHLGRYLSLLPGNRVALLTSAGGSKRHGARLVEVLKKSGITAVSTLFNGECSLQEVDRIATVMQAATPEADTLIGADSLGREIDGNVGDTAYRTLHRTG